MISTYVRTLSTTILAAALTMGLAQSIEELHNPPPGEWPQYGRDSMQTRYSPLDEINVDNVGNLTLAWARDLDYRRTYQGTPAVWEGIMYVTTHTGVIALDATNGDEIWRYDAPPAEEDWLVNVEDFVRRGSPVVYDGKVFINLRYGATVALDKDTGEEVWFTQITDPELNEGITAHPIFADGRLIIGPTGADGGGAPGRIISLDTEDGEVLWTFNVVPLSPDDPAYASWTNPPSWDDGIGGASAWNAGAYDPVTRTVVYGTGQPTPWDRLDDRRSNEGEASADLYSASFVAVDVDTGELKWYHQVVPGDEWDYDQHVVPIFADIEIDGSERRVALLPTTTGYLVVIDAESGEFLLGEPMASEHTIHLGYEDDGTPIISAEAREANQDPESFYPMCPGLRWAHISPGAFSPDTGLLYRPNHDQCLMYQARSLPDDWEPGQRAFDVGTQRDDEHWPEDRLGALTAIDPSTGEVVWEFSHQYGHDSGPVVTAGNLVFTSSYDRRFRAFNAETGEELFSQVLTAGSSGGSMTYEVDGKQYVATMVGLHSVSTGANANYNPMAGIPEPVVGNAAVFVFTLP